jgi:hypothetical protein
MKTPKIALVLALFALLAASCGKAGGASGLEGKWVEENGVGSIEFFADGKLKVGNAAGSEFMDGTWAIIAEGKLSLVKGGEDAPMDYKFSDGLLVLKGDSGTIRFKR